MIMEANMHIGMIGTRFMGKAHSHAFRSAPSFFDIPFTPVLHTVCGRDNAQLQRLALRFGWKHQETSWEKVVENPAIDVVDICTPNHLHFPVAVAAATAGKHVLCEKPLARHEEEAWLMYETAANAGVVHMTVFNYRFVPAIALAKRLIDEGKIGQIRHFNAVYFQDWLTDPGFPMVWRHDASLSGSGAHGDMNAHIVDLARFLVGEFAEVNGVQRTFIKERPMADGSGRGRVTVDDATSFLALFRHGAIGSFTATRLAPGRKNFLRLEIFGSLGSLLFDLERINELQYHDGTEGTGFQLLLVTEPVHPYMEAWWPPGHVIGWEHTFVHVVTQLLGAIHSGLPATPDFFDGFRCQQVLDAVVSSAASGSWKPIPEITKIKPS